MTLPHERTQAVLSMRDWLLNLAHQPGRINKRDFRRELRARLKHYPTLADMATPARSFDAVPKNQI